MKPEYLNVHVFIHNRASLLELCVSVVEHMFGRPATIEEIGLMIGTAFVESDNKYRFQKNDGPARGIWQMEPGETGAQDIFTNYLSYQNDKRRKKLYKKLTQIWLGLDAVPFFVPSKKELGIHLACNDWFACAMARLQYYRVPKPLPTTVHGLAKYWKTWYNSIAGKGTEEKFLEKWDYYRCDDLLEIQFGDTIPRRK